MQRSKYSKEFKDPTVQLILNNNESVVDVAADLGLNSQTLYNWISKNKRAHNIPLNLNSTSIIKEPMEDKLKRLRRENKILKQERDILKKATAYFAKETL